MKHEDCEELPEHLIYTIFLNLPVKALIRFESLSKRWNKIIASPAFEKHHYIHNNNNKLRARADHLLIHSLYCESPEEQVICYRMAKTTTRVADYDGRRTAQRGRGASRKRCIQRPTAMFEWPRRFYYEPPRERWFVSSSCHGLLCMTHYRNHTAAILVWNPFTGRRRRVSWPGLNQGFHTISESFVGFGYDHVTDDYKIVVNTDTNYARPISYGTPRTTYVVALKNSSGDDAWRRVDGAPDFGGLFGLEQPVTWLDGDAYWISWTIRRDAVIMPEGVNWSYVIHKFNFTDETLTVLPPPNSLGEAHKWQVRLGQYKQSLCFFDFFNGNPRDAPAWIIHVWTLRDEQGDEAVTWSKIMSVPFPYGELFDRLEPWGFTIDGDLIIKISLDNNGLLVYLVEEDRFVDLLPDDHIQPGAMADKAVHHLQMETLISPLPESFRFQLGF